MERRRWVKTPQPSPSGIPALQGFAPGTSLPQIQAPPLRTTLLQKPSPRFQPAPYSLNLPRALSLQASSLPTSDHLFQASPTLLASLFNQEALPLKKKKASSLEGQSSVLPILAQAPSLST